MYTDLQISSKFFENYLPAFSAIFSIFSHFLQFQLNMVKIAENPENG
jgi:hypothetical protein